MDFIDTELFIDEVKKRPALWDSSIEEYKNRQLKKDIWLELCGVFFPKYKEMDNESQKQIRKDLQMKWRHVRDAYVRNIRHQKSRSEEGAKPAKAYVFARRMDFLKRFINTNATQDSLEQSQDSAKDDDEASVHDKQSEPVVNPSPSPVSRRRRVAQEENMENCVDTFQQERASRRNYVDSEDMTFFMSLIPTLQTLRREQKLKFRVDVMNSLLRYYDPSSERTIHYQNVQNYHQPSHNPISAILPDRVFHSSPSTASTQQQQMWQCESSNEEISKLPVMYPFVSIKSEASSTRDRHMTSPESDASYSDE